MNYLRRRDLIIPSGAQNWWGYNESVFLSSKIISGSTVYQLANNPGWNLYQRQAYNSSITEYVLHQRDSVPAAIGSIGRKITIAFPFPYAKTVDGYFHPFPVVTGKTCFGYIKTTGRPVTSTGYGYMWEWSDGGSYSYPVITTEHSCRFRYCYDNDSDEFYFYSSGWKFPVKNTTGEFTPVAVTVTAADDNAYKLVEGTFPIGLYRNTSNKEALVGFVAYTLKANGSDPYDSSIPTFNYATYQEDRIVNPTDQEPTIMMRGSFDFGLSVYMDLSEYYQNGYFKTSQEWRIYHNDVSYWSYTGLLPYYSGSGGATFTRHWEGSGDDPYPFSLTLSFLEFRDYLETTTKKLTVYLPTIDNGHWQ